MRSKIKTRPEMIGICEALRGRKKKIVFTNGCFDLLHAGHVRYLEAAAQLGDALVVGLNTDDSVRRLKGPGRPVMPEEDRAEVMAGLAAVSWVTLFDEDTPEQLIRALKPDILAKGADWPEDEIVGAQFVKSYGGRVERIPLVSGRSTSDIINAILRRNEK